MTRKEWAEGWPPGYTEPDSEEQETEKLELSWTQWLLALVGIAPAKEEPKPDPTFDPDWQPQYC